MIRFFFFRMFLFFAPLAFLLFSCQKNVDVEYPIVQFLKPYENAVFSVGDTIPIEALISDNIKIDYVEIVLTNSQFIPVSKSFFPPVSNNLMHLVFDYPLEDYFLESGDYLLLVKVSDGVLIKHKYLKIKILAVNRYFKGLAVAYENANNFYVSLLDSNLENESFISMNKSPISGLESIGFHNRLAFLFQNTNKVEVWDYVQFFPVWSVLNSQNPNSSIENISTASNSFFLFFSDGSIKNYNYSGSQRLTIKDSGLKAKRILSFNNYYIILSESNVFPFTNYIRVFHALTGKLIQVYSLDFFVLDMFQLTDNKILVIGNQQIKPQIRIYDVSQNSIYKPKDLLGDSISEIVFIDTETILLKMADNLYILNPNTYSLILVQANSTLSNIIYEPIQQVLIGTNNSSIEVYLFPSMQFVGRKDLNFPIRITKIKPLYNR